MKRIHPTRRERAAIRASWYDFRSHVIRYISSRYSGRRTSKQRRQSKRFYEASKRTFKGPHGGRAELAELKLQIAGLENLILTFGVET